MRSKVPYFGLVLAVIAGLTACTDIVHLQEPKTGRTVACGGEMWNPMAHVADQRCMDYWKKLGYGPVQ